LSQAKKVSEQQFSLWTSRLAPKEGDILYSREGERFGLAALVPSGVRLCISQRMMLFRIKRTQCSEFIMWQLNCPHVYTQASADIIGAAAPHINVERIRNYRIVIPPRAEQLAIVEYIGARTVHLEKALSAAARDIGLIRELRTRLVADLVTGKLDVREAAAELAGEPVETQPLEELGAEPEDEVDDLMQDAAYALTSNTDE
jgi:type I restriction enzyme S subunit